MQRARCLRGILYFAPLAFLGVFYVYPLLSIFDVSLRPAGLLDLSSFVRLLSSDYYIGTLLFTIYQAALSTAVTLLLATPCAFALARYQFRGKTMLLSLATLPFVLPTVVVALAFATLLGANGLLNDALRTLFTLDYEPIQLERTLAMIIIAHVFYNFAVALRIITGYWSAVGFSVEEAARCLGADELALWREIRLPLLRPALLSAGVLVFIFSFTSFGVILILGGIRFATLEVQIYYQAVSMFNLPLAAALSLVQILSMLAMMIIYTSTQKRLQLAIASAKSVAKRARTLRERLGLGICAALISILLFAPLVALALRSVVVAGQLDFANYASLAEKSRGSLLFIAPLDAVFNSLRFALIAMTIALCLGLIASYMIEGRGPLSRIWDPLFMLPLATSAVTLGFGFIIALDEPPLNLRASWLIIPISHTLVALPFVIRSVLPSLRTIPRSLREAAQTLGATPVDSLLTIDLPLLGRGIAVGATFAFTVSMGEFGASLFVAQRESVTIPVVIYRLLGDPGMASYRQALAMSVVLMLVCACAFVVIERLRIAGVGEF
ncbi:MAG: iron ABC transporter permease [Chloroflexota bacterium]|nr:iron ABC transporter permease [Chloroflexota bacterium]MDE2910876.1 iron ABC transporter permease [Chloroflexota bacterium]